MLLEDRDPGAIGGWSPRIVSPAVSNTSGLSRLRVPAMSTARPSHPNDAAQARLFSELMRAEIADLEDLMAVAQRRWSGRRDAGWGSSRTPEPVLRLREKIKEVQGMLDGLQARFDLD
ncbi:hypothetical protein BayCH28_22220 [Mycolicibacterium sp. CH28]|uniref:hypothetical protein n=1 Tax=Mycolicibacterium sp. CH28 TaxID=2512237 RepID=UPI00108035B3|nr:hypothetical protein [Mycolicibacterium sp. CH28]TGD85121.1 hypothetical protein BayCH28_22220 [Mycolicibacterium sp. CH28]